MTLPTTIYIPIETDIYDELVSRYGPPKGSAGVATVIDHVVRDFLDRTQEDFPARALSSSKGVYWQNVFMPNGTHLRMTIHGKQHFAEVEAERILYEGKTFSPSSWANHIAGHARNAWRDIYVKRAGDSDWTLADHLRRK